MGKALTKADLVEAISMATRKNQSEVKIIVDELVDLMIDAIVKDHTLLLSGFGKFDCVSKAARKGRNPVTKETIILPARNVVTFRISRVFRREMNQNRDK